MSFSIQILGSGSAVPTSNRSLTSQYIECSNRHILIDCGEGTQTQMRKFGVKFQRIDIILISHLHGDHYFGLVGLLSTMHLLGRVKPIKIFAPSELKEIVMNQLNYGGARLSYDIEFIASNDDRLNLLFEDEKITIQSFPLSHKIPTTGFLITEKQKALKLIAAKVKRDNIKIAHLHILKSGQDALGENGELISFEKYTKESPPAKSYAFCSDTKYYEAVVPYIKNATLLYHEATFTEFFIDRAKATMHSTAQQAARIASAAKVDRLLMGHLSARYGSGDEHVLEASPIFENCEVVEDGNTYFV